MYSWTCSCGDGAASVAPSREDAQREGSLHVTRAGRLRDAHVVLVREAGAAA